MELATKIFTRLTEVEKCTIRGANQDRLDYLADSSHRVDMVGIPFEDRCATMTEVQSLCALEFAQKSVRTTFDGVTWKF